MKVVEVNGRWRMPYSEIERLLSGGGRVKQVAIYARVSPTQRDDLERQLDALREWVRKTLGGVSVIEKGYRFRIERGQERVKEVNRVSQEEAN